MTRRQSLAVLVAAVAATIAFAVATSIAVRQRARLASLEQTLEPRTLFCDDEAFLIRQFVEREATSSPPTREAGLSRMRYHHLAPSVLKLCLGQELPLDPAAADGCWIRTGDASCYVEIGRALLDVYRRVRRAE